MRSRITSLSLVVLAVAATVGTRQLRAQQVAFAASLGPELDSATQAALSREYARARERGIPVEPLAAKVREGRLKSAAGLLIRVAVSKLSDRLASARAALGPESSVDELIAGADALAAGADEAALRALRAASTRPIAAPIGTLAQLLASGVEQKKAVEMIVTLLRRKASPTQLLALGNLVETDVASGLRPNESASVRMRGIEGSLGNGDTILQAPTAGPGGPTVPITSGKPKPVRRP